MQERPRAVVPVLVAAVLAISTAPILVRLAEDVHPLAAAFWRNAIVALLLAATIHRIDRRDAKLLVLASLCLALHFWTWFTSLHHTTVLRSTVLVTLTPFWVGLLETIIQKRPPPRQFWMGIAVAVGGVTAMTTGGGPASLEGDGLALLGGFLASCYFFIGREVRQKVSIGAYGALVSGGAACWLLVALLILDVPLVGHSTQAWGALVAMAMGPQLMGHVGLGYAVKYVAASRVSALVLLEPVGATLYATVLFAEIPTNREVAGAALVLVGIYAATAKRPAKRGTPAI